jgi:hypothetical protein
VSSGWTYQLTGIKPFREILRRAGLNSGALAASALYQEALRMMAVSQRQVPVRYGILRSTGHVYPPQQRGAAIEVTLAYGGPAAPYAWVQHENLDLNHDDPTKAKYLEDPVVAQAQTFSAALARRMAYLWSQNAVLGSQWPTEHWHGPPGGRGAPRTRRSTIRPTE